MPHDAAIHAWQGERSDADPRALRQALGCFATGVTVVTTVTPDGRKVGVTASSFNSVSMEPPLILWSLSSRSPNLSAFRDGSHFAVNVLAASQVDLCNRFGRPLDDKFADLEVAAGLGGSPLLPGAVAQFECACEATYPGGDHLIILGRVLRFRWSEETPLLFCQGRLGAAAPAAPALAA
ncbi:flavin reductase family protein [Parasulfuritortus cantonensis]|uniref:flavin reductase family protein n=1 Tax=Parasulfuritortus cantonensis TaxID=2528202 RepID=UPI00198032B4|nr:flavin reductase family protein [Parasulfuritortus cantonensis]